MAEKIQVPAFMGFAGFVRFKTTLYPSIVVRAKTAEINVKQEITKPDVIDSRFDRTVYQLGPKEIDGSIEFPSIYDAEYVGQPNITQILFDLAVKRDSTGLLQPFGVDVRYAATASNYKNKSEFTYNGCIANSWNFSVAKQDVINTKVDIIGISREETTLFAPESNISHNSVNNARAATWNDARVEIYPTANDLGDLGVVSGEWLRNFECTINNNANRFYTLNGNLFPQSVAPTKRDITGRVVLMGRHESLAAIAVTNEGRSAENSYIRFGFLSKTISNGTCAGFGCQLPNVVFQIEEMALTNDLFETTVNWHSLPAACSSLETTANYDSLYESSQNIITWRW